MKALDPTEADRGLTGSSHLGLTASVLGSTASVLGPSFSLGSTGLCPGVYSLSPGSRASVLGSQPQSWVLEPQVLVYRLALVWLYSLSPGSTASVCGLEPQSWVYRLSLGLQPLSGSEPQSWVYSSVCVYSLSPGSRPLSPAVLPPQSGDLEPQVWVLQVSVLGLQQLSPGSPPQSWGQSFQSGATGLKPGSKPPVLECRGSVLCLKPQSWVYSLSPGSRSLSPVSTSLRTWILQPLSLGLCLSLGSTASVLGVYSLSPGSTASILRGSVLGLQPQFCLELSPGSRRLSPGVEAQSWVYSLVLGLQPQSWWSTASVWVYSLSPGSTSSVLGLELVLGLQGSVRGYSHSLGSTASVWVQSFRSWVFSLSLVYSLIPGSRAQSWVHRPQSGLERSPGSTASALGLKPQSRSTTPSWSAVLGQSFSPGSQHQLGLQPQSLGLEPPVWVYRLKFLDLTASVRV
uniref:Uncharacterized protein n=1 Tax=Knipowitschia caucasica TaxID=637954 RepID=A0AAV2LS73_KNICA